jgi:hypothetical protein
MPTPSSLLAKIADLRFAYWCRVFNSVCPVIHDLREKTPAGKVAEEFRCAMAIVSWVTDNGVLTLLAMP